MMVPLLGKERVMQLTKAAGAVALLAISVGCASSGTPVSTAEMSRTEDAVRSAENAQAAQDARDLLDRAHAALTAARREWQAEHFNAARSYLAEAEAAARAAEAKSRTAQLTRRVESERKEVADLEKQLHDLSLQLQKP
jgi:predicted S18 family serine protease